MTTVVVGAGAAGAPLAARLSEDPDRRVILLEAGRADGRFAPDLLDGSTVQGAMPGHPANWSYHGNLTPDLPYTIARGRVLGGSSAINGGYFVRARPGDLDTWADAGGPTWTHQSALPVLAAMERDLDFGDRAGHGSTGPMPVQRPSQQNPATVAFHAAAAELGFPAEPDKNASGPPGAGPVPLNVIDGVRTNTGLAYIEPIRDRPNLDIRGDTQVLRVLIEGNRVTGVETTRGRLDADEVVLCAGAIASPHLLMCSGIGSARDLEQLGVRVVADLPVGEAFSDHPDIAVGWKPRRPINDPAERFAFPAALNFSSSPDAHPDGDLEVMLAVKPIGYLLTGASRAWSGGATSALRHPVRTARSMLGVSARRAASQLAHADDLQLIVGLQAPQGRGTITLRTADFSQQPRIDYRYLEEDADRNRMRTGIRTAVALLQTESFADVFAGLTELEPSVLDDDAALDRWMRSHLGTAIHMCGSVPMGPVVDGAGRVHGVNGLRVADTSILPTVPSRGPFASAVLVGELLGRRMRDGC